MKILIDIGHPAHIHYFRNLAKYFINNGSQVLFVTRDKDVSINLLKSYKFDYVNLGKPFKHTIGKVFGLFWFTLLLIIKSLKFKPDIFLNSTNYAAYAAWILKKPHISIEDSFNMEQVRLYLPFTSVVLTEYYPHPHLGKKEINYSGYQELAYLHPNRYMPNKSIFKLLNLDFGEKYVVLRFVSWNASHDLGQKGLSIVNKLNIVDNLKSEIRVFISSEGELPEELKKYQLTTPSDRIHDVLAFATLFIGEGTTMASESAVLGTPAIYINSIERGYTTELDEKYGLVYNFRKFDGVVEKAKELIKNPELKTNAKIKQKKMLNDKIDVTAFYIWFIENYPGSAKTLKENPDYQLKFRN